jgi:hypothetical protein
MNHLELQQTFFDNYKLGASYCRNSYEKGGVCILVQENIRHVKLDLENHCSDKDLEICATKVYMNTRQACIIAIYRAPTGSIDFFMTKLDTILGQLYTVTTEFIICGDINIDYLTDNERKRRLEALLKTYNLTSVVNFPTRTHKHSATAIDNIFINHDKMGDYSIRPIINGLSDHDAQSISVHSFSIRPPPKKFKIIRGINEQTINDFLINLSYENWDAVFSTDDVNKIFNSFLDTYLKNFNSSFPLKRVRVTNKTNKNWITLGILTSCKRKRELFIASRSTNDLDQRFPNFFPVGTTVISQNVLRTTLLLFRLKANCLRFTTIVCDTQFTLILFFSVFFGLMFNLRGPQRQNPRTTCGPRTTVWETLT